MNNFDDLGYRTVSRYADVASVLTNSDLFSSAGVSKLNDALVEADPPDHDSVRKRLSDIFSPKAVSGLEWRIREICDELLLAIRHRRSFDLIGDFSAPLQILIGAQLLDIPREWTSRFAKSYKGTLERNSGRTDAGARIHATRCDHEFESFLEDHLDRCRQNINGGSLTHTILRMADDGLLTEGQTIGLMKLMVIAVTETTVGLISNTILTLLKNPGELQLVRQDPELIPDLVVESLRYESSVQFVQRWTTREVEIGGVPIPSGTRLFVLLGSANRDERQFEAPDRFSVKRNSRSQLAFGGGPHFCLGASLARLEAYIALQSLLFEMPPFDLARPNEPVEMLDTLQLRAPKRLDLIFRGD